MTHRLERFWINAGPIGVLQTAVVFLGMLYCAGVGALDGDVLGVLLLPVALALPWLLRHAMVDGLPGTRSILNGFVAALIVAAVLFRGQPWVHAGTGRTAILLAMSAYVSAFFWLLSDPRVRR